MILFLFLYFIGWKFKWWGKEGLGNIGIVERKGKIFGGK